VRNKRFFRYLCFLMAVILGAGGFPLEARSQDWLPSWPSAKKYQTEEERVKAQEEEKERKRNLQIYRLLEKGREERYKHNYKGARNYGEKAIGLDPENRMANAFMEQLAVEEQRYRQEQEDEEKEKKRAKEEKLLEKKQEELDKKREKEETIRRAQEEKLAEEKAREGARKKAEEERLAEKRAEEEARKEAERRAQSAKREAERAAEPEAKEEVPELAPERPAEPAVEEKKAEKEKPLEKEKEPVKPGKPAEAVEGDLAKLMKPGQPIIVDGDKVEFFEKEGRIVAEGNVSITYGDVKLTCDKIEVNSRTKQAYCEGNVRIEQAEGTLTGDKIRYDFINKVGEIVGGEVDAFPWFGRAEETGKVGENEYLLRKGYVTTCDLDDPHYRIVAKEIQVFPDDKIIAKNVVAYIGKVPVLWFPYYYHPIIQSRAKVQFIPGSNSDWGYFLLSAWRFNIKGNSKVDVLMDYRTKKGFAEGANIYYDAADFELEGLGYGLFRMYFIEQNGWGTYSKKAFREGESTDPELRTRFQWKHRIEFDPTTVGMLEFNKQSDEYILKDYFYNEYEENNPTPLNYISVISAKQNYTFSFAANLRFNDFYTVVERIPELKLEIPDQRLWDLPLYYSSELSATKFKKEYAFISSPTEETDRLDWHHKLSYVTALGPINLTPYGTFRETLYSETKREGASGSARMAIGGGINIFSRYHRVFDVSTNAFGLDINGLRHIVVPTIDYFYLHQPTVDRDKLFYMDDIDRIEKRNGVRFSLENKLQTKRHVGDKLEAVDLVRFIAGVDYLFNMKKRSFAFDEERFENLNFDLELRPYDWFYIEGKLDIVPKNQTVSAGSVEFNLDPCEDFHAAMGYRYEKKTPAPRNQLTFDMSYRLSPKWKLGWYERFDFEGGSVEEQQFSIVRDLHCWEVEVVYDIDGSNFLKDDYTFWVVFKIKAFPDLPIGLNRSFQRRPPGTLNR
jgi:lipopolysaccharide assembly outer membrane protein LptD (OstA)